MHTNLLIILVIVVVLGADVGAVFAVRQEVRRWCYDAFRSGVDAGKAVTLEASEPFAESYRLGYDVGHERGHAEGYDRAINDAIERPEAFTQRLQEIRPGAGRWTDTGSGPGYDEGTAWDRHDDPRA